jgi:hypothetical protein
VCVCEWLHLYCVIQKNVSSFLFRTNLYCHFVLLLVYEFQYGLIHILFSILSFRNHLRSEIIALCIAVVLNILFFRNVLNRLLIGATHLIDVELCHLPTLFYMSNWKRHT